MEPVSTAVTAATSLDVEIIKTIIEAVSSTNGTTIATLAVVVNIIVTIIRNSSRLTIMKVLGLDKLIAKIPPQYIPLIILVLSSVGSAASAIASGSSVGDAILNATLVSLSAVGIHETTKPVAKMKVKK